MFISIGLFVLGLVLLIYGADSLVQGASSVAKKAGLSALFIGLTVVAFGTSLPELVVNIFASLKGSNDIAIGNILGSNIANIFLILGISAAIWPLSVRRGTINKEIPFSILAVIILYVLVNDTIIDSSFASILSRSDGLILLAFFTIFIYYTFAISRAVETPDKAKEKVKIYKNHIALSMIIGGILGLTIGGTLMIEGAISLARFFQISEALIGLTIVAVGTSLPELATSAAAALRRSSDIAIGNIVGSNIFNIFWILGISSTIKPLIFSTDLNFDILLVMAATIILMLYMFVGKRNILQRWQGVSMVSMYVIYIIYLFIRG